MIKFTAKVPAKTTQMQHLTFEQYITFLLLFAAFADDELCREEILKMLETVDKESIKEVKPYFAGLSLEKQLEVIRHYRGIYLDTPRKRKLVYHEIVRMMQCDRKMHRQERLLLKVIQNTL